MHTNKNYISIYVRSIGVSPSGYYRIIQYLNHIDEKIKLNNIVPPKLYRYYLGIKKTKLKRVFDILLYIYIYYRTIYYIIIDIIRRPKIVIISRGLIPRILFPPLQYLLIILKSRIGCLIWDFDDDILNSGEISKKEFNILQCLADKILVTHDYLASQINQRFREKCIILPTTDGDFENQDIQSIIKIRSKTLESCVNIVWLGSAVNLKYLTASARALDLMSDYIQFKFNKKVNLIVCSSTDFIYDTSSLKIINIRWTPGNAIKAVLMSHIGIMPLIYEKYVLGKGGFKLIQYMAAGLPIIGSNIGFNKTIIGKEYGRLIDDLSSHVEWVKAVSDFIPTSSAYIEASISSRKEFERNYSFQTNLAVWKELINCNSQ